MSPRCVIIILVLVSVSTSHNSPSCVITPGARAWCDVGPYAGVWLITFYPGMMTCVIRHPARLDNRTQQDAARRTAKGAQPGDGNAYYCEDPMHAQSSRKGRNQLTPFLYGLQVSTRWRLTKQTVRQSWFLYVRTDV
jgi:hypothetical protein